MARVTNKLTGPQVKNATLEKFGKRTKLADGNGLYLDVQPSGRYPVCAHLLSFTKEQGPLNHHRIQQESASAHRQLHTNDSRPPPKRFDAHPRDRCLKYRQPGAPTDWHRYLHKRSGTANQIPICG
jgi:hypothetical protein